MTLNWIEYRPPRIAQLLVLLAAVLHWSTPLHDLRINSGDALGIAVGAGIGLAGFGIMLWAWWLFRQADVAICPTAQTDRLVTGGIYRYSRNPMYLGMVGMLVGIAVAVGTLPFYAAAAAYFAVIDRVFIPYEERKLEQAFGVAWEDYRAATRRWF